LGGGKKKATMGGSLKGEHHTLKSGAGGGKGAQNEKKGKEPRLLQLAAKGEGGETEGAGFGLSLRRWEGARRVCGTGTGGN